MTPNTPKNIELTAADLAALEAQIAGLAHPATTRALDAALAPETPRAGLADEAVLLSDARLAALLDEAMAVEAPAGLADRVLAAAPLHAAPVAGRLEAKPATAGRAASWTRKPWRYAAVASVSFSLSLMAVSFIVKREAAMFRGWTGSVATDISRLQNQVVGLDSGISDEALEAEFEQTKAEMELAGL